MWTCLFLWCRDTGFVYSRSEAGYDSITVVHKGVHRVNFVLLHARILVCVVATIGLCMTSRFPLPAYLLQFQKRANGVNR